MMESAVARSQVRDHQRDRNKSKGKTSILRCRPSLTTTLLPIRRYSFNRSTEFEVTVELSAAFPLISKSLLSKAQPFLVAEEAQATRLLAQSEAASSQTLSLGEEFWHRQSCLQFGFLKMYPALAALGQGARLALRRWPWPRGGRGGGSQLRRNLGTPAPDVPAPSPAAEPLHPGPRAVVAPRGQLSVPRATRRTRAEPPNSSGEGEARSGRGGKSELEGNADSNAEKTPVLHEAGPELARRARAAPRARWRGSPPGASNGPGRRAEPRLQDAPEPLARRDAGSQQQPGKLRCSPTLPRNGSPRRSESARERCCQAERGTERGRASNNHLLPLSAIQGRNKTALSIPWESSPGLRKAGLIEKQ
ncbi:hypothetical protein NN561_010348 [Cricetulus griseus]